MPASQTLIVRLILCAGCVWASAGAGGCTTAAVASAGTMVGLAASAVSTGADVYQLGKLDAADQVRMDDLIAAVRAAADDLHLKLENESRHDEKGQWHCALVDERGAEAKVIVQRRTQTLCRTRINVGWFGSEPTARLILSRMRVHVDSRTAASGADDEPASAPAASSTTCPTGCNRNGVGRPSDGSLTPERDRPARPPA